MHTALSFWKHHPSRTLTYRIVSFLDGSQQKLPVGIVVREVTERLHCLNPSCARHRCPTRVAVKLLKVLDHGLGETFLVAVIECPDLWGVEEDSSIFNHLRNGKIVDYSLRVL